MSKNVAIGVLSFFLVAACIAVIQGPKPEVVTVTAPCRPCASAAAQEPAREAERDRLVWHTRASYWAASKRGDLERATRMLAEGDRAAVQTMLDAKQVVPMKAGVEVFLQESDAGLVRVRVKGQPVEFWTVREAITQQ